MRLATLAVLCALTSATVPTGSAATRAGQPPSADRPTARTMTILVGEKRNGGWDILEPFDVDWNGECAGRLHVAVAPQSGHALGGGDHWMGASATCLLTSPAEEESGHRLVSFDMEPFTIEDRPRWLASASSATLTEILTTGSPKTWSPLCVTGLHFHRDATNEVHDHWEETHDATLCTVIVTQNNGSGFTMDMDPIHTEPPFMRGLTPNVVPRATCPGLCELTERGWIPRDECLTTHDWQCPGEVDLSCEHSPDHAFMAPHPHWTLGLGHCFSREKEDPLHDLLGFELLPEPGKRPLPRRHAAARQRSRMK